MTGRDLWRLGWAGVILACVGLTPPAGAQTSQEELEKTFLHGQAGNQLIAAQHHQLQRAQSLMSRLLVQATRSAMPTESVAVEVLPPRPARGLLDQGAKRSQGWGTGLMRKIWSR